ncbi:MAG TPA: hypothetical protein DCM71_16655 [Runella sp.]|nr:hypothetical protein [Runella sp.]
MNKITKVPKLTNEEFKKHFTETLAQSQRPPFLFVGSGISIRYYSIPTWMNLLKEFVETNKDCFSYEFGYYSSKCSKDPLKIASNLAAEFHEYWWKAPKYSESRVTYQEIAGQNTENAFKIELSNFVNSKKKMSDILDDEISSISSAVISGILTTNWDDFLQNIFTDFQVEVGQKEAIFADQRAVGELYKIHGCISKPESLVVTTRDYEKFILNNHYLNAKLLTLFAEYPIIFMGYSLSDPNIELILKNLIQCLDSELFHVQKLTNRLFFVEWVTKPCHPSIETATYNLSSITIPLIKIKVHDYKIIWDTLTQLPRTLPVKTLRQLQNMVFDFVTTLKPTGKVYVNGMEELDTIENLEVVVGFGNISKLGKRGVIGLNAKDLMKDILFGEIPVQNYNEIVEKLLPKVIRQNNFVPFFKYQRALNNLNNDNSIKNYSENNFTLCNSMSITIDDYRVKSNRVRNTKLAEKYKTLENLLDDLTPIQSIQLIPYLEKNKFDLDLLLNFLKGIWQDFGENEHNYSSNYRKCICLLDFLKYSNQ